MGDVPDNNQPSGNLSSPLPGAGSLHQRRSTPAAPYPHDALNDQPDYSSPQSQPSFQSQLQQQYYPQYQPRQNIQSPLQASMPYPQPPVLDPSFNMASLGNALPSGNYAQGYSQHSPQTYSSRSSASPGAYQMQHNPQYLSQSTMNQAPNPSFPVQYSQQYQATFGHPHNSPLQSQQSGPGSQFFPNQNFMVPPSPAPQQFFYPGSQYPSQSQNYSTTPLRSYPAQFGARNQGDGGLGGRQTGSEQFSVIGAESGQGRAGGVSSGISQPSMPRGPPRKPKQSGHALWVGNLPPGANVIDLKEHFSQDATDDIFSVFLISKSNCAFVNYRTEESCAAAMSRFHDSRFQGVRLVCRLRRSTASSAPGVSTGPSALSSSQVPSTKESSKERETIQQEAESVTETKDATDTRTPEKDRYFIVKSLTVEDLELSVRNGIWATQSHNEDALNEAYENSESVYLIFSANKSGEYFGYARMVSPINNDPAAAIEFAPTATTVEDPDLPKAIPTPATEFAPKGRIIDDSARGTIFWEADIEEVEGAADADNPPSDHSEGEDSPSKNWGKPFKIEWQSTNRLPFYRTRGLRNPWNSNREVKIARDGTELETSIGRRLISMFHREQSPSAPTATGPQMQMPPNMGGYSQMRY